MAKVIFKVPELIFKQIKNTRIISYTIKNEKDMLFEISEYNKWEYNDIFKSDPDNDYCVEFLENNMVITHTTTNPPHNTNKVPKSKIIYNSGSVLEVVKFEEKYYLIRVITGEINRKKLIKCTGYLKEFNILNKLRPLMLGV